MRYQESKHKYESNKIGHCVMDQIINERLKETLDEKINSMGRTAKYMLSPTPHDHRGRIKETFNFKN